MSFSFAPPSSQQTLYSAPTPQSNTFGDLGSFASGTFAPTPFGNQPLGDGTAFDPNNPEVFRESLKMAQTQVEHIRSLAHAALVGIQKSYNPGVSAAQTAATLQDLRQAISELQTVLMSSGVGALPLLPPGAEPLSEQQIFDQTTKAFNDTWALRARNQEAAAMVANLLSAPDQPTVRR